MSWLTPYYMQASLGKSRDHFVLNILCEVDYLVQASEQNGHAEIKTDNTTKWILYLPVETDIFARLA